MQEMITLVEWTVNFVNDFLTSPLMFPFVGLALLAFILSMLISAFSRIYHS